MEITEQLKNWEHKDLLSTRKSYRETRKKYPEIVPSENQIKNLFDTFTNFKKAIGIEVELAKPNEKEDISELKKKIAARREELFGDVTFELIGKGVKLKRKVKLEDILINHE